MQFERGFTSIENLLFQKLIQSKIASIQFQKLSFSWQFHHEQLQCFMKFLKDSKIKFLILETFEDTEGFDAPEFLEYLRNSSDLVGFG